ncbi:hypothetical protein EJV44_11335 [Ancylobacter aquaticus]|nr:hypothetical protein EJV44_11335 [Ancylobacter aquaticus]
MEHHPGERPNYARDFTMVEVRALRKRTEAAVDALLALLDEIDSDPDLEPSGDEADCSAPEGWRGFDMRHANDDAEDDEPAELDDFPEEDDPAGGDVCDEPHDADSMEGAIADLDGADEFAEESAFCRAMDRSRPERLRAHDETLRQIARVTGRMPRSHWGHVFRIGGAL